MPDYPQDFIDRCKAAYPEWERLHKALAGGEYFAGHYLDDASQDRIDLDQVLAAKTPEDLSALQRDARAIQDKKALYCEWSKIVRAGSGKEAPDA